MIFFSLQKRFFTLLLGVCLVAMPILQATEPVATPPITQDTWGTALSKAWNTTLLVAPTLINTCTEVSKLSSNIQKYQIGDTAVKPEIQTEIQKLMHEQNIPNACDIEIIAMRGALYQMSFAHDTALPTPQCVQVQSTFKHNVLGVYVTNACIFIDEDIINFEKSPLLSTFLIKHALKKFKNNEYRNTIFAKIGLGLASGAALYKTIPLVNSGMQKLTNAVGWTSFSDSQKSGILLNTARVALNGIVCPMIAQSIVQKLSSQAFAWYKQSTHEEIDETLVAQDDILPLIVELAKIVAFYRVDPILEHIEGQFAGQRQEEALACAYMNELCILANKLFTTTSIITWLDNEMSNQDNAKTAFILKHYKMNFFSKHLSDTVIDTDAKK